MRFYSVSGDFSLYGIAALRLNTAMGARQKKSKDTDADIPAVSFEDLLVAVGQGKNRDAFVRLFEYFAPRVKSFLMKGGMTPELADEIAQETMLTVWDRAESYDPRRAAASTWIFTVARNKRIDYLRKAMRPEPDQADLSALYNSPEQPDVRLGDLEDGAALAAALETLPPEQAEIIYKSFFEEKSHGAIAAETALPLGTIKSRIRLALGRLREAMQGTQPS